MKGEGGEGGRGRCLWGGGSRWGQPRSHCSARRAQGNPCPVLGAAEGVTEWELPPALLLGWEGGGGGGRAPRPCQLSSPIHGVSQRVAAQGLAQHSPAAAPKEPEQSAHKGPG